MNDEEELQGKIRKLGLEHISVKAILDLDPDSLAHQNLALLDNNTFTHSLISL